MNNLLLSIEKEADLKIFLNLSERLNIKSKIFTNDEILDLHFLAAMKEGQESEFMSKEELMQKLTKYEN
ncbi:MAG: hypothetical protein B6I24_02480 [Bacteroidetes bacterium 4572_128]|nr:MAG: hypothetical protein B6I24_02480 [Bacteroidetes bacterium 4572_128]